MPTLGTQTPKLSSLHLACEKLAWKFHCKLGTISVVARVSALAVRRLSLRPACRLWLSAILLDPQSWGHMAQMADPNLTIELLNVHATSKASGFAGLSLRMWAALHQSLDMVQLVIRHGANPNLIDERGEAISAVSVDKPQTLGGCSRFFYYACF